LVDALKVIASQLIILHHLAFYGPMSDRALELAPGLFGWFADHARIAVQVFLVLGGFLAAKALAPQGGLVAGSPVALVGKRYLRLALPCIGVLALAVFCAWVARAWMQHDSIPSAPTVAQILAHVALLQDVLGFDALSAGLWYVAIDLQLFSLFLAVLWIAHRFARSTSTGAQSTLGPALVGVLALASLFFFNRDPEWDRWAVYFFGAYGMGAAAFWAGRDARFAPAARWLILAAIVALALDFRLRIAVALVTTVLLLLASRSRLPKRCPGGRVLAYLSRIAYSVFLVHFPICLVVNAAWSRFVPDDPWQQGLGITFAWAASVATGALFHRLVESRTDACIARARRLLGLAMPRMPRVRQSGSGATG
jgi:peptidoglycan/LPS O-acetylase OafA/YrhL